MQGASPQPGRSNYVDFELEIGLGRGREYPVTVLSSPAGEAHATMHFPFDELALDLRLGKLQIALLRSGGKHRRAPSEEERAVQDLGRSLFDALFSGRVRTCYDVSLREAAEEEKGLRLKLRIRPPELNALPWEFLYNPDQAEYICLSRQTPIVRYLESHRLIQPLTVSPPLRILGMVASPEDLPMLDIEREKQRVERATGDLRDRGLLELEWLPGQTWRDLQEAMWGGPWHVFHFIGHGGFDVQADEGFIALADDVGRRSHLNATRLGRLLADHAALRLVLLNACEGARGSERDIYSSTASILVHRGIPAVVAMQYEITDRAAIEFARAFYRALAYGMAVDEAVVAARKAIDLAVTNTVEWGTPVLYMRTPDGVLFHLTGAPQVKAAVLAPPADAELERRLEQRYTAGLSAFWLEEWDEACGHFQAIVDERPGYQDAADKLAEAQRQKRWGELYEQAQSARKAENWEAALSALEELVAEKPDYKDAAASLEDTKRRVRLAGLYAQARRLRLAQEWQAVVNVFAQIEALDPDYPDPEGLLATAKQEIAATKGPPPFAEPVPKRRLPRWAMAAIGGLVLVTIVAAAILLGPWARRGGPPMPVSRPANLTPGAVWEWSDGSAMVYVPAGTFVMGSTDEDLDAILSECSGCQPDRYTNEWPEHRVYLDAVWIDRTEVTNAMFTRFVADTGYETDAEKRGSSWTYDLSANDWEVMAGADWKHPYGPSSSLRGLDKHPVVHVSWEDAAAYCQWATKRLPTEAEWEKAARGTDGLKYPWGDTFNASRVNSCDRNCELGWKESGAEDGYGRTAPVGSYLLGASPYGALDMAGNVWEWAADWYGDGYYADSPANNPKGPDSGSFKVLRGGSWDNIWYDVRAARRNSVNPVSTYTVIGFRCARSDSESPQPVSTAAPTRTPTPTPTATARPPTNTPPPTSTPQAGATRVWEKDDSVMVYVPAGEFPMGSTYEDIDTILAECDDCQRDWYTDEQPQHTVTLDAFWIDSTEVTNAQYRRCVEDGTCRPPSNSKSHTRVSYHGASEYDDYPVIFVDWDQANTYCAWAGKRLPTEAEWEKAARAADRRIYPWGSAFDGSFVNFCDVNCEFDWKNEDWDDGYADTAPVGNYPDGASPYGALDMAGNVWEWTSSLFKPYPYDREDGREDQEAGGARVLRGGSWDLDLRYVRAADRGHVEPSLSNIDLGFRCARSDSEPPQPVGTATPTHTPPPTSTPTPSPQAGATRVWEKDDSVMVYVPAGEFPMGTTSAELEDVIAACVADGETEADCRRRRGGEGPQHAVHLDAFWIDRTEVTNAQYQRCVDDGGCSPPSKSRSYTRDRYYGASEFDDYPVIYVDRAQANAYCTWAGKRLPTEAEWEKAARGTDKRIYPWGSAFDGPLLNFCDVNCEFELKNEDWDDGYADTAPAGTYPGGASPYGALDMAGNVWEWVADWYSSDYYAHSPDRNPQGPDSGEWAVLRGGSWRGRLRYARAAFRSYPAPSISYYDVGFRCARSDSEPPQPVGTATPTHTPPPPTSTPQAGATRVWEKDDSVMVYVPAGEFPMGSTSAEMEDVIAGCVADGNSEEDCRSSYGDEGPQHTVYLDAFWIDRTEVTNAQYAAFLNEQGNQTVGGSSWLDLEDEDCLIEQVGSEYRPKDGYADHPVIEVTWHGAGAYCAWLGKRLPTEAEWEKAGRGDDRRIYPWGQGIDCSLANYEAESDSCVGETAKVGSYQDGDSPYGALDMAGNVWEWVADWYGENYYDNSPDRKPQGPDSGGSRVRRGGSWSYNWRNIRVANRGYLNPSGSNDDVGFRCARSGSAR